MPIELVVNDVPSDVLVARFEAAAKDAIAARGRFAIALPGGSVATTCFPKLAEARIDWSKTHFFWGDERAVPPTDPDSNYGVAEKLWLSVIGEHMPCVHRMEAEDADLDAAATRYEAALREHGPLDIALLGMGPDGHVCSLFPGDALLEEKVRRVAAITHSPKPPPRRLTVTMPVLAEAGSVIVVAMGEAKAEIVRRAHEAGASLPVARALRESKRGVLLLDRAAASKIDGAPA